MSWGIVAGAAVSVIGGALTSDSQSSAATDASSAQTQAAQMQIDEARRQFDKIQELLRPYVDTGNIALTRQAELSGLRGDNAQAEQLNGIMNGPLMKELMKQGEDGILQNASATGGIRGGNVQGALAQFRPQLANQLINQRYNQWGGLASMGQNSAAGVGAAGQASSNNIISALGQQGAAQAGNALAQGQARQSGIGGLMQSLGGLAGGGSGLFGGSSGGSLFGSSSGFGSGAGVNSTGGFGATPMFGGSDFSLGSGFFGA